MSIAKPLLAATLILSLTACAGEKGGKGQSAIRVVTEVATASNDHLDRSYVGTIEENSSTPVSFTGIGTVSRMCVSEGQHVSKGQLIAVMDETQARNMIATAEAQMAQANDALQRMKQLHEAGSLPDIKWVEVQSQVSQAKSQLDMAHKNLSDCSIHAPVSGVISSKPFEQGMTAVSSMTVATILDISTVKVRIAVPEREMATLPSGTHSTIQVEAIGRSFEAVRLDKGVTADPMTHTYEVKIPVANPGGHLLPGMIANVVLHTKATADSTASCITLPIRSIQQHSGGEHFVWIAKDGKAHRNNVTIGETYGNRVIILSGLKGGETVITEGYQKVGEGSAVKV